MVRPRPGAGRRHRAGQHQPGPDRPGAAAVRRTPATLEGRLTGSSATRRTTTRTCATSASSATRRCWSCRTPGRWPARRATERDYAVTIVRNFLYGALMAALWPALQTSARRRAGRHRRQVDQGARYHLQHAAGLGGAAGRWHRCVPRPHAARAGPPAALYERMLRARSGRAGRRRPGRRPCRRRACATAGRPSSTPPWRTPRCACRRPSAFVSTGKLGVHSEHMSYLLAEMQGLARAHPGAQW